MGIFSWSKTAGSNTSVEGQSWAEGMLPSGVNNGVRSLVAGLKSWQEDIGGALTAAGSSNAYTVSTNSQVSTLADGIEVCAVASFGNTAAATLNVDATGVKAMRKITATSGGDTALVSGDIRTGLHCKWQYDASANLGVGAWILLNPISSDAAGSSQTVATVDALTSLVVPAAFSGVTIDRYAATAKLAPAYYRRVPASAGFFAITTGTSALASNTAGSWASTDVGRKITLVKTGQASQTFTISAYTNSVNVTTVETAAATFTQAAGTMPANHDLKAQDQEDNWFEIAEEVVTGPMCGAVADAIITAAEVITSGTDNTAAFNRLAAYVRASLLHVTRSSKVRTAIGAGLYRCSGSINFTGIGESGALPWGVEIDGRGATIISDAGAGKIAFDCLGSRYLTFRDFHLYSPPLNAPAVGLAYGRVRNNQSADNIYMERCLIDGWYSYAATWNLASEDHQQTHCYHRCRAYGSRQYAYASDAYNILTWDQGVLVSAVTASSATELTINTGTAHGLVVADKFAVAAVSTTGDETTLTASVYGSSTSIRVAMATGTLAARAAFDASAAGTMYFNTADSLIYRKASATSGDWETGINYVGGMMHKRLVGSDFAEGRIRPWYRGSHIDTLYHNCTFFAPRGRAAVLECPGSIHRYHNCFMCSGVYDDPTATVQTVTGILAPTFVDITTHGRAVGSVFLIKGAANSLNNKLVKVSVVTNANRVSVTNLDGTTPNLVTQAGAVGVTAMTQGGFASSGIRLITDLSGIEGATYDIHHEPGFEANAARVWGTIEGFDRLRAGSGTADTVALKDVTFSENAAHGQTGLLEADTATIARVNWFGGGLSVARFVSGFGAGSSNAANTRLLVNQTLWYLYGVKVNIGDGAFFSKTGVGSFYGELIDHAALTQTLRPDLFDIGAHVYTITTLPAATSNQWRIAVVSNGLSFKDIVFSDGTVWRYMDGTAV